MMRLKAAQVKSVAHNANGCRMDEDSRVQSYHYPTNEDIPLSLIKNGRASTNSLERCTDTSDLKGESALYNLG